MSEQDQSLAKVDETKIATLKERVDAMVVTNAAEYSACCALVIQGRNEIKAIGFVLDPGIQSAKEHLEKLKRDKAVFVDRVKPIVEAGEKKAEEFKAEERRLAKIEEDRKNAELRADQERKAAAEREERDRKIEADRIQRQRIADEEKKRQEKELKVAAKSGEISKRDQAKEAKRIQDDADRVKFEAEGEADRQRQESATQEAVTAANAPQVQIKANVPKVAGIKGRVNFKFEIVNAAKVKDEFKMPDSVAIGEKVRRDKDVKKSEAEIGGIRVYEEDSI